MDRHPFDQWREAQERSECEFREKILKDTSLVYHVFSSPEGKKLLDKWTQVLINQPTARAGDDLLAIGIAEGYKNLIRQIIQSVQQHEEK